MNARQIIQYIPENLLTELCIKYNVNHQVKKLDGRSMFQLLLYSFLTSKETSYRVIEEIYHSIAFSKVSNQVHKGIKFNSIRDRLTNINSDYFEAIFTFCIEKFCSDEKQYSHIILFDSTLVAISSKLLESGMKINKKGDKRYIKFTIGFRNIPVCASIYSNQKYLSEDIALGETILQSYCNKEEDIVVFDRGLQSRKVLQELSLSSYQFVTRINSYARYEVIEEYPLEQKNKDSQIRIDHDYSVRLYDKFSKQTTNYFRLIIATKGESKIYFLTNIIGLSAHEITEIYKKRWEIEVFFKFIKQQLNFSHLLSRNENGIKVVLYMTLISSILLTLFKNENKLKGYKIPKLKFAHQLEALIIEDIVILCGGDPLKIKAFYNSA